LQEIDDKDKEIEIMQDELSRERKLKKKATDDLEKEKKRTQKLESEIRRIREKEVKNVLLFGFTGSGKSTLANVLTNRREIKREVINKKLAEGGEKCYKCKQIFVKGKDKGGEDNELLEAIIEEKGPFLFHKECFNFKESSGSISETRQIQSEIFSEGEKKYRVIDTIGIGDTKLPPQDVLYELGKLSSSIERGLSQIFFVFNGRFTKEEINAYNLLRSVVFDDEVIKYTTIIRTNFPKFYDKEAREKDRKVIRKENREKFDIIDKVKIIYVDNPSVTGLSAETNKEIRNSTKKVLVEYLNGCQDVYRPENLDEINERIGQFFKRKEKEERIQEELRKEINRSPEDFERLKKEINESQERTEKYQQKIYEGIRRLINESPRIKMMIERLMQALEQGATRGMQALTQRSEEMVYAYIEKSCLIM